MVKAIVKYYIRFIENCHYAPMGILIWITSIASLPFFIDISEHRWYIGFLLTGWAVTPLVILIGFSILVLPFICILKIRKFSDNKKADLEKFISDMRKAK